MDCESVPLQAGDDRVSPAEVFLHQRVYAKTGSGRPLEEYPRVLAYLFAYLRLHPSQVTRAGVEEWVGSMGTAASTYSPRLAAISFFYTRACRLIDHHNGRARPPVVYSPATFAASRRVIKPCEDTRGSSLEQVRQLLEFIELMRSGPAWLASTQTYSRALKRQRLPCRHGVQSLLENELEQSRRYPYHESPTDYWGHPLPTGARAWAHI